MNIVFYDEGAGRYEDVGGGQIARFYLASLLSKSHNVTILTGNENLAKKARDLNLNVRYSALLPQFAPLAFNEIVGPISFLKTMIGIFLGQIRMIRQLNRLKPDVLHCESTISCLVGGPVGKLFFKCIICTHLSGNIKRKNIYFFLKLFYTFFFNRLYAVSKEIKKQYSEVFGSNRNVLLNYVGIICGVSDGRKQARAKLCSEIGTEKDFFIISCDRLNKNKDHLTIVRALERLKHENFSLPSWHWFLAGEGPTREDIEAEVQKRSLTENVTLLGYRTDVPNLLEACDLLILSSKTEAFPRIVQEAMWFQKPVICSKINGSQELVEKPKSGIVFDIGDTVQLKEAIESLILSDAKRSFMGRNGAKHATKYDQKRSARFFEEDLQHLFHQKKFI